MGRRRTRTRTEREEEEKEEEVGKRSFQSHLAYGFGRDFTSSFDSMHLDRARSMAKSA